MIPTIEALEKEIEQFHSNISGSNALMGALNNVVAASKEQTNTFEAKVTELEVLCAKLPAEVESEVVRCITAFSTQMQEQRKHFEVEMAALLEKYEKSYSDAQGVTHTSLERMQQNMSATVNEIAAIAKEQTDTIENKITELEAICAKLPAEIKGDLEKCIAAFSAQTQSAHESYKTEFTALLEKCAKTYTDAEQSIVQAPERMEQVMNTALEQLHQKTLMVQQEYADQLNNLTKLFLDQTSACMVQLDEKYSAFLAKLNATNMDKVYGLCEQMNRSVMMKLNIALCGVGVAVILAVIGLFI